MTWCKVTTGITARKLMVKGERGWPDRTMLAGPGQIICIEFKSPVGKLSPQQIKLIRELREAGVPVLETSCLETAKSWFLTELSHVIIRFGN